MTPPFPDRRAAGRKLAERLVHLAGAQTVVLGLPRGGVPVADEVARHLNAPLDIVLVRKIGMPMNPELALGAIAGPQGQTLVLNTELVEHCGIDPATITAQAAPQREELARRSACDWRQSGPARAPDQYAIQSTRRQVAQDRGKSGDPCR